VEAIIVCVATAGENADIPGVVLVGAALGALLIIAAIRGMFRRK